MICVLDFDIIFPSSINNREDIDFNNDVKLLEPGIIVLWLYQSCGVDVNLLVSLMLIISSHH